MRIKATATLVLSLLALAASACGGGSGASQSPATAESSSGKGIKVGDKAPTFSIDSLNGQGKVTVAPGKVTLVDFWATWCEPCRKSFPKYQELYVKYKASGLEIAAISNDDDNSGVADFAKQYGAKFPVGWDEGHKIAASYEFETMPSAFLIGKDGLVKKVHFGYHDGEEAELDKEIRELLAE